MMCPRKMMGKHGHMGMVGGMTHGFGEPAKYAGGSGHHPWVSNILGHKREHEREHGRDRD